MFKFLFTGRGYLQLLSIATHWTLQKVETEKTSLVKRESNNNKQQLLEWERERTSNE